VGEKIGEKITRTLRIGLLGGISLSEALLDVASANLPLDRLTVDSIFSCELAGSGASLEGTGVESLVEGFVFGRELALVSFRGEEYWLSDETFSRTAGELETGEDFWKNDIIDFCLVEEGAAAAGRVAFAGVRAALAALSPGIVIRAQMTAHDRVATERCWAPSEGQYAGYLELGRTWMIMNEQD
jgi:hypothetical protein